MSGKPISKGVDKNTILTENNYTKWQLLQLVKMKPFYELNKMSCNQYKSILKATEYPV